MRDDFLKMQHMQITFTIQEGRLMEGVIIPVLEHRNTLISVSEVPPDVLHSDGLYTQNHNLKLGVYTADCASICISDSMGVAVVHVGWRGLCTDLLEKTLRLFSKEHGDVFVGPHRFELEFQEDANYEQLLGVFGKELFEYRGGKIFFQFKKALASRLPEHAIFDSRDTEHDMSLPSYRRDKTKDIRLITVVQSTHL
jgi:copper oxidase (laccase) domain-containing protein